MSFSPCNDFFMGNSTSKGYILGLNPQEFQRIYILRGVPANGKSTLLSRLSQEIKVPQERFFSTLDSNSLDGLAFNQTLIIDGTAPEIFKANYIGAVEVEVNLWSAVNHRALEPHKSQLMAQIQNKKTLSTQCRTYERASNSLFEDVAKIVGNCVNTEKLDRLISRLTREYFSKTGQGAEVKRRILTAQTTEGITTQTPTITALAKTVVGLQDDFGVVSNQILTAIKAVALEKNYKVIACGCPSSPLTNLRQLIIPELSLAFATYTKIPEDLTCDRVINCRRFLLEERYRATKNTIVFERKAAKQLQEQGEQMLKQLLFEERKLGELYSPAVDYKKVDLITQQLLMDINRA